jgi:pimeloyl-ACP methyl ester carboxylesterase
MTAFVLVPGAGGAAWYWHRVVDELAARGHEGIAVDLPAGREDAGLDAYADAVVAAAGGRRGVVVVGQSLGGFTAPVAAQRLGARLLVLVNAMVPRPGEQLGRWWEATGFETAIRAAADRDGRDLDADPEQRETMFHDVPPDVTAEAFSRPFDQTGRIFADTWPDAWPDVPTRVVAARDDRFFPLEFQRRVARERLGLDVDEVPGGHLVALSRPVELTDHLLRLARG